MAALYPFIGRRQLLASSLVGAIGVIATSGTAHAATTPSSDSAGARAGASRPETMLANGAATDGAAAAAEPNADPSIRPFRFRASDDALADLRRRVAATIWPEQETVADTSQGVKLATMRKIAEIGSGEFFRVTDNTALQNVFKKIDQYEKAEIKETRFKDTSDYYYIYLRWAAVFFLLWLALKSTFLSNVLQD